MSITAAKMAASKLTTLHSTKTSLQTLIRSHLLPSAATHLLHQTPQVEVSENRVIEKDPIRFFQMGSAADRSFLARKYDSDDDKYNKSIDPDFGDEFLDEDVDDDDEEDTDDEDEEEDVDEYK